MNRIMGEIKRPWMMSVVLAGAGGRRRVPPVIPWSGDQAQRSPWELPVDPLTLAKRRHQALVRPYDAHQALHAGEYGGQLAKGNGRHNKGSIEESNSVLSKSQEQRQASKGGK